MIRGSQPTSSSHVSIGVQNIQGHFTKGSVFGDLRKQEKAPPERKKIQDPIYSHALKGASMA